MKKPTAIVDLDGVLAEWRTGTHDKPGLPVFGAENFTRKLRETHEIVIHTCRCNPEIYGRPVEDLVEEVCDWLDKHCITYDRVYGGHGKPWGEVYIDDRAMRCRPEDDPTSFFGILRKLQGPAAGDYKGIHLHVSLVDGMVNIDGEYFYYANIPNMYQGGKDGTGVQVDEGVDAKAVERLGDKITLAIREYQESITKNAQ